jgi:thiamine transport system permease protein
MLGGGPAATTIEVAIYQALRFDFDPGRAVALSLMQIAVTGIVLAALALLPTPDDPGPESGKRPLRIDGEAASARLWDGMLLLLAALFVGLPLFSVVLAGLKADLPKLATQPVFLQALATSLAIALAAGLIAVSASLAIVRARHAVAAARGRNIARRSLGALLGSIPSLVLLAPPIVLATGWFMALRPLGDPTNFAVPLIIGINMLMALPFVIRVVEPAYRIHRQHTERLALSLGLQGISRWRLVDWPGLRRPLMTSLSFAMAPCSAPAIWSPCPGSSTAASAATAPTMRMASHCCSGWSAWR